MSDIIILLSFIFLLVSFIATRSGKEKEKKFRTKLVGFHGAKGSGKNTAANLIANRGIVREYAIAMPLKNAAENIFGFDYDQLYGDKKEDVDERWGVTPRHVLQQLGTDFLRVNFGDDVLIKSARININKTLKSWVDMVAVTDVRFDNEAELIRELGGIVIRIDRGPYKEAEHASERPISLHLVDYIVKNNGTKEELLRNLLMILEE